MYINEAVQQAVREEKYITLPEFETSVKIRPTNEKGNCILMRKDGSHPSKYGWQPTAEELMRNDWEVVD